MYNKYKSFDLKTFKKEFESGDLCGLEYLEKNNYNWNEKTNWGK